MRVDDVEALAASELQTLEKAHRQIGGHRRQVGHRHLAAEEHRHSHDAHAVFDAVGGEAERTRGEHRDVMTSMGQLCRHGSHDDASASTDRWILVITQQDLHAYPGYSARCGRCKHPACQPLRGFTGTYTRAGRTVAGNLSNDRGVYYNRSADTGCALRQTASGEQPRASIPLRRTSRAFRERHFREESEQPLRTLCRQTETLAKEIETT